MEVHELRREQHIAADLGRVFDFFSRAENLERITPGWLGFRIRTPLPVAMRAGTRLEYRIRIGVVPVRWLTRIAVWEPPRRFVDVQERGPYRLWEHTHAFEVDGDGVRMTDCVRYALPLGPIGRAAHALAVRATLGNIFDFRAAAIAAIFSGYGERVTTACSSDQ